MKESEVSVGSVSHLYDRGKNNMEKLLKTIILSISKPYYYQSVFYIPLKSVELLKVFR